MKSFTLNHEYNDDDKLSKSTVGISNNKSEKEILPPPPPPPKRSQINSNGKQSTAVAREEDDIFVGAGTEYEVPGKDISHSPLSEDMEESPRNKEKVSFFSEPAFGPVPPSAPQEWQQVVS